MNDNDNRRDMSDNKPDEISVLFLEGYCMVPTLQNEFWTCDPIEGQQPFGSTKNYRVWCTDAGYLDVVDEDMPPPDDFGVEACIAEIESGKYHAIVVVDYSCPEFVEDFDNNFGSHLQKFVAAGGVVVFPSTESVLIPSLKKWFGVEWTRSSYYQTDWSPCEENMDKIHSSLGNGSLSRRFLRPYNAKGNSLRSVPIHERCFGNDDDYDILIAMHDYGKGVIAYFGDVNAEEATLWLVAAFVESRSPRAPIDVFSGFSTRGGDLSRLREASKDVLNSNPGDDTRRLRLGIKKELRDRRSYSIIPFKFDFDQKSLQMIEFERTCTTTNGGTETVKFKVPLITTGASRFQVLFAINEFTRFKKNLALTSGPRLYDRFSDFLRDCTDMIWWNDYVSALESRTTENFSTAIDAFITYKFNNNFDAYRIHRRFLYNIKKTTNMTVHQFVSHVKFHNHVILPLLPGHPPENAEIKDDDFKYLIFESMPDEWKITYQEHHSPYEDTLAQIVTRMERYEFENKKSKKNNQDNSSQNRNNSKNNSKNNRNNNNRRNRNNRNGNNRNNGNNRLNGNNSQNRQQGSSNSQGNNNNNPSTRVPNSSKCPIHPGANHTWGQCYGNVRNPNRPNRNNNNGMRA